VGVRNSNDCCQICSILLARSAFLHASSGRQIPTAIELGHLQTNSGSHIVPRIRCINELTILVEILRRARSQIGNADAHLFGFPGGDVVDVLHVKLAKPVEMPARGARTDRYGCKLDGSGRDRLV
jgi:hypothetical protein